MVVEWASEGAAQLAAGSPVWFRIVTKASPDAPWAIGILLAIEADRAKVQQVEGKPLTHTLPLPDVQPANPEILQAVPDLTSLSHLNEPSILHALNERYMDDVIYTTAGPVLIALNPCKNVPLYGGDMVDTYRRVKSDLDAQKQKPHVFLNAGKAFRDMMDNQLSQSMVISGESGAGKTETTKKAMQFFAQMSGGHGIEDQVLQTNPLLEAFGNAKTLRNHNSSRFGKLLEIHFNKSNHISGAKISTYLLEKSRVVHQISGERSFHIFYQMLRGASADERVEWKLPAKVEAFKYLNGPGAVSTIERVDDAADFREVRAAMTGVRITPEVQNSIFCVVSAVLWMGNVSFTAKSDDEVHVNKDVAFDTVCELLGVSPSSLDFALTHRLMTVGNETYEKPLNLGAALDTRDALAKALYAGVFSFLVDCINESLAGDKRLSGRFIAILDIYGFESFKKNSFEQLCINYANERLQQQFNKHLFKLQQEEYEAEGIDWSNIAFEDNQDCLDTIDSRPPRGLGVMTVLDDQCNFPRSTDASFCSTCREVIRTKRFTYKQGPHIDFILHHYAGPVTYDCTGFLDKNRDTLSVDLVSAMQEAKASVMSRLLPYLQQCVEGKNKATVSSRFREQLSDLLARLDETEMHFVRCIKPNYHLKPSTFDQMMILQQLRCCGVLEVVRIAKAGYPTRYFYAQFVDRYVELMPKARVKKGDVQANCKELLKHFRIPAEMYKMGYTKIFFKAGVLGAMEDLWRRTRSAVLVLQAQARMMIARDRFLKLRRASTVISAHFRGWKQRRKFKVALSRHRAAIAIQRAVRGYQARREAARRRWAIVVIQCGWRMHLFHRRCKRREADMRQALEFAQNRAVQAQTLITSLEARLAEWEALKEEFGMTAPEVHDVLSMWRAGALTVGGGSAADGKGNPSDGASGLLASPAMTDAERQEFARFRVHKDAFVAWRTGTGSGHEASNDEMHELEVWRAHRKQFFEWQRQQEAAGASGVLPPPNGKAVVLEKRNNALRAQLEEEQERSAHLHAENCELRSTTIVRRSNVEKVKPPIDRLRRDFENKVEAMEDDLQFIEEVVKGSSAAVSDFNAELELRKLKGSFDQWKELFKNRMKNTYAFVKRSSQAVNPAPRVPRAAHGSNASGATPESPRSVDSDTAAANGEVGSARAAAVAKMREMKEGLMGATKKGTVAVKGMVGKLQRRMGSVGPSANDEQDA